MSKVIESLAVIGTFFKEYTRFSALQVVVAVAVFKGILASMEDSFFEVELADSVDDNGRDKDLKKTLTATIPVYLGIQAKAFSKDILAIPEDNWVTKGAIATVNAYVFKVSQVNSEITLEVGATLTTMRAVATWYAQTNGRKALLDLFNSEDAASEYSKMRTAYTAYLAEQQENAKVEKESAEASEDTSPPDDDGGNSVDMSKVDKTVQESFARLGASLANAQMSKGQAGAVARLINEVTAHVEGLSIKSEKDTSSGVEVAPKVQTKAETKKTASK